MPTKQQPLTIAISSTEMKRLKALAVKVGKTPSDLALEAIREMLSRSPRPADALEELWNNDQDTIYDNADKPEWKDEIVEEVRRVRDEYAKSFIYDLDAICNDLRKQQRKSKQKLSLPPRKSRVQKPKP